MRARAGQQRNRHHERRGGSAEPGHPRRPITTAAIVQITAPPDSTIEIHGVSLAPVGTNWANPAAVAAPATRTNAATNTPNGVTRRHRDGPGRPSGRKNLRRRAFGFGEGPSVTSGSSTSSQPNRSSRYATTLSMGSRSWVMVSRSRTVTWRSSIVSKSTVTQYGVPTSS
jgi:hypothetical protein